MTRRTLPFTLAEVVYDKWHRCKYVKCVIYVYFALLTLIAIYVINYTYMYVIIQRIVSFGTELCLEGSLTRD
jgi:hypothetical protein